MAAMRLFIVIIVLIQAFSFFACRMTVLPPAGEPYLGKELRQQINALLEFREEFSLAPGQVSLLSFPYYGPFYEEALICNDMRIPFAPLADEQVAIAYLSLSYFHKDAHITCAFHFRKAKKEQTMELAIGRIRVEKFSYPEEKVYAQKEKVVLSPSDQSRVLKEKEMLSKIYQKGSLACLFTEPFKEPLRSKVTSIFGTSRIFNDEVRTQHLGTDYRAPIGTVITPSNTGKVVFCGELFYGGNTVIVDHGLGIFTSYSHLSKISTKVGHMVLKTTPVGLSGMSGRVSGPHLHWGVALHDNHSDGPSLVRASQKHFSPGNR